MRLLGILNMDAAISTNAESRTTSERVHVAIMRVVRPGREREFEAQIEWFFQEAARQPGVCGAYLIRPIAGSHSREYGTLRSFASTADRDRFYVSDLYRHWNEAIAPLVEGPPRREDLHGLEAFFRHGARPATWKMALLTWLGVNPAVYIFSNAVPVAFGDLPPLAMLLVVNVFVVASLAWGFMPLLTKIFRSWLEPAHP